MTLQDELIAAIAEWDPSADRAVARDTPLITSSRLDSLNLVKLLLWIEERAGRPVDATAIDIAVEWNTVDDIVGFVERNQSEL